MEQQVLFQIMAVCCHPLSRMTTTICNQALVAAVCMIEQRMRMNLPAAVAVCCSMSLLLC